MQLVEIVANNAKFHLSQDRTNQSTVTNVFQTINQHLEEAQVAEDLEAEVAAEVATEVATEEALTEDHEKCTKRLVETVVKIVKFHSSQKGTSQSIAQNVFKVIEEIKITTTTLFFIRS